VCAAELVVSDRDRILADIYIRGFGDRISSTIECRRCGQPFDLSFSLRGLIRHLGEPGSSADRVGTSADQVGASADQVGSSAEWGGSSGEWGGSPGEWGASPADGLYRLEDGTRFRLPTGADELAIQDVPEQQRAQRLLELCIVHDETGPGAAAAGELESALAELAPLLSTDLLAVCPECSEEQPLHFDIQTLLFLRLAKEKWELVQDVHLLASTYKWSRAEILSLSREERRAYRAMIVYERQ
jgi:hypothetical protein